MATKHLTFFATIENYMLILTNGTKSEPDVRAMPPNRCLRSGGDTYYLHIVWTGVAPSSHQAQAASNLACIRLSQMLQ